MVADAKNRLVSGRKYSQMVLIEPELARDAEQRDVLVLKAPGMDELSVRLPRTEDMGAMQEETVDVGGLFLESSVLCQSIYYEICRFSAGTRRESTSARRSASGYRNFYWTERTAD